MATDPIVSVEWLAARLQDPKVVVVDATLPPVGVTPVIDTHARYLTEHLPGAVFFDIEALSDSNTPLPHMLPTEHSFAESMSALGIGDAMTIVVYEQEGVFSAPRAWWMLRTMGAHQVYMLDGGLRAWKAAGHPVESGPVHRPRAAFQAAQDAIAVQDFAGLRQALAHHAQVLDARSAARFEGTAPEPRAGLRSGHMPGATSLPYTEVVADGRLKTPEDLKQVFAAHAIDLQQPVTTTCGSGVTAAVLAIALQRCGATQVRLYDGSWAEYAQQPEAVIATGR
jgi:thiosulfate/3-mercaptopyruvate sulfurtransferase